MKYPLITLFFISQVSVFSGVGGVAGGPPKALSWAPKLKAGLAHDWPLVNLSKRKSFKLDMLCLRDDSTLRTLRKFRRFDFRRFTFVNEGYKVLERVFSQENCSFSKDPKCELASQYVHRKVSVPVYSVISRRRDRDGLETMEMFIRRVDPIRIDKLTIPKCK